MTRNRKIASAVAIAGLVGILAAVPAASVGAAPSALASKKLLWSDEFDGRKGASVKTSFWNTEVGNGDWGWGNQELQYYTKSSARLDGKGKLVITAKKTSTGKACWNGKQCRYTSARLTTASKVSLTNGTASVRLKLPKGVGLWSAFWMLGANNKPWPEKGEIDVMEWVGKEKDSVFGTAHGPGYSGGENIGGEARSKADGKYHVYSVTKLKNEIRWFVDGKQYFRVTPSSLPSGSKWVFNGPFYLVLNLAVGGQWPGSPTKATAFPQKLVVDYVKVTGTGTVD